MSKKDDDANMKQLKRRLKNLLEPLIQSLGVNADNISFLLRMTELVGGYEPVCFEGGEEESVVGKKLKVVCAATRECILKYVKTDAHLAPYPGLIQIPLSLFKMASSEDDEAEMDNNYQAADDDDVMMMSERESWTESPVKGGTPAKGVASPMQVSERS